MVAIVVYVTVLVCRLEVRALRTMPVSYTHLEFLEKLVRVALPRIRDFKGIESKFDGKGNYTLGIQDVYKRQVLKCIKKEELRYTLSELISTTVLQKR